MYVSRIQINQYRDTIPMRNVLVAIVDVGEAGRAICDVGLKYF